MPSARDLPRDWSKSSCEMSVNISSLQASVSTRPRKVSWEWHLRNGHNSLTTISSFPDEILS